MIGEETKRSATLTIPECAKLLGIGKQLAYDLARAGKLPGAKRLGRRVVVSRQQLNEYLSGSRPAAGGI